jgi:hypothetical protein
MMNKIILITLHLSKATECLSRCHTNAKLHFSSSVTVHIFAMNITGTFGNTKLKNIKLLQRYA